MSDSLLGVIIGGLIGFIPSLVGIWLNSKNAKADREHQIKMKQVEIYTIAKRDALQNYMNCLGKASSINTMNPEDVQNYLAAAKAACIFVSPETADYIETVSKFVIDMFAGSSNIQSIQIDSTVVLLNYKLRDELKECLELIS